MNAKADRLRSLQAQLNSAVALKAKPTGNGVSLSLRNKDSTEQASIYINTTSRVSAREAKTARMRNLSGQAQLFLQQSGVSPVTVKTHRTHCASSQPIGRGWPKIKQYRVEELIGWWNALWRKHFPQVESPRFQWNYMRRNLLAWLKEVGHVVAEAVVEFAFDSWKTIQHRYERLADADGPSLSIIFGYRSSLIREMQRTSKNPENKPKWAAAQWKANEQDEEAGYSEEVLSAI